MNIRDKINLETPEHAFLGTTGFSDTVELRWQGVYFDVSQTKHGIMQEKSSVCLFVALRPKSIAMVMAGRSVHLTTLFPGQA